MTADGKSLSEGWRLLTTPAGAVADPAGLAGLDGAIDAPVPGTVAGALERAGRFDRAAPAPLDHLDAWYLLDLSGEPPGAAELVLDGLATLCEVYWNGVPILSSGSMYVRHRLPIELSGQDRLALCFRALRPHIEKRRPRARWRPQMITPQGLRLVRTTLLGRMPGWCPEIHAAGPWRPVRLVRQEPRDPRDVHIAARLLEDGTGQLDVRLTLDCDDPPTVECAGVAATLRRGEDGCFSARLAIPQVEAWWPHTHGRPALHPVELVIGDTRRPLGRTGFRRIEIDRGADGRDFALHVNGVRIFCRGVVWTTADIVDLPGERARYAPLLQLAARAGMNMLRIGGTMVYESPDFFALCDELGLMVWQDFMFANFDYPVGDDTFLADVRREVGQFLDATAAAPSLSILCGGSEIDQQAAMLGLPESARRGPLTTEILPELAALYRADVPYVENSPSGGAMPFSPDAGVTHYYGVGAYCRPLEDARRANVRFAAESLAFANVPEQQTLDAHLPVPAVHDPRWKARVPRDRNASWDFEDIRDHYLALLYDVDPARLRREDPARYLDLSRAASGAVMEATFAEWRRPGSTCNGALVWTFQDLLAGPGWGVVDAAGMPKPAWHALRRAFRPVQILLADEGTNGLDLHVLNEKPEDMALAIELSCLRHGRQPVVSGRRELALAPRSNATLPATALFGAFFDTTYAFRFGPPAHDVTVARLKDADGATLAEAFHFPQGRRAAIFPAVVTAVLEQDATGWALALSADRFAQSVMIEAKGFSPSDNWFHLAPGDVKTVRLTPLAPDRTGRPSGEIRGLGIEAAVSF
ncbi:glycoside hydrolase family 2 protein [Shinella daejeonensis]|uniref:glycoside hydrolase family 2 protein n=1 Tax=Shinella daejeonensis TaxID=659017 RepID=UPI0020C7BB88|nr:glycoside hydrolase family 2 protein [Shinella daejeonensis]MCP8896607.1 glycoside hydrolase family 2 protein [Shinella daejeonensis]